MHFCALIYTSVYAVFYIYIYIYIYIYMHRDSDSYFKSSRTLSPLLFLTNPYYIALYFNTITIYS
jgi:hypothetical protein